MYLISVYIHINPFSSYTSESSLRFKILHSYVIPIFHFISNR